MSILLTVVLLLGQGISAARKEQISRELYHEHFKLPCKPVWTWIKDEWFEFWEYRCHENADPFARIWFDDGARFNRIDGVWKMYGWGLNEPSPTIREFRTAKEAMESAKAQVAYWSASEGENHDLR